MVAMRWTAVCGAIGAIGTVLLLRHVGFTAVLDAMLALGLGGMGVMALARLPPQAACAGAWWLIAPRSRTAPALFLWFRCLRDAANEILGIIPCAGEIAAVRAMMLAGQAAKAATAGLVADLTVELAAQIAFTVIGAALLLRLVPEGAAAAWVGGSAAASAALLAALIAVQRMGIGEILRRLGARIAPANLASAAVELDRELRAIYVDRSRVARAAAMHLMGWTLGGVETWIGCRLLGAATGLDAALALEAGVFAMRSAAFSVPAGLGVQEGGYVVIGAFLGLPAETTLALSLAKRGRDLTLAIPVLLAWQGLEARYRRRSGPSRGTSSSIVAAASAQKDGG